MWVFAFRRARKRFHLYSRLMWWFGISNKTINATDDLATLIGLRCHTGAIHGFLLFFFSKILPDQLLGTTNTALLIQRVANGLIDMKRGDHLFNKRDILRELNPKESFFFRRLAKGNVLNKLFLNAVSWIVKMLSHMAK